MEDDGKHRGPSMSDLAYISQSTVYTAAECKAKRYTYTTYRTNDARGTVPIIFYIITPYDTRCCQHSNTYSHIVIYSLGNYVK